MVANRNVLKAYAPQARKDFIRAMSDRAAMFGVTKDGVSQGEERGDLFLLDGKAFPKVVAEQRKRLLARVEETSFAHVMEAVAYTWFNRFLAIRYMELHGYFEHGYRVLSHPSGEREPEILQQAQHLNLPGLDPKVVVELKLEGDKDEVLYRRILIAQCNDLHKAMPFLFERIDDETELLLPENLLQSDSIVRALVNSIAESEWDEIEIIGWLYQFYISEKKDQVIGKVVKSEDIPAATQLFTPNWIVKYMVQNSLGAQWLATYPDSPLKAAMAYYIEPAEQTPEVQAQLDAITPRTLDPEAITLIDPAVGSGHILVEAYDLFRAIYIERGYTPQAAARAILTKNLYGLDIDDRAAQMAGFALLMKARADDRTLLSNPPALNVMSLTDSIDWDVGAIADALVPPGRVELLPPPDLMPETVGQPTLSVSAQERGVRAAIAAIAALFDGAKTFGSLITVPDAVITSLPELEALLAGPVSGDLLRREAQLEARERLKTLVDQANILGRFYDNVVANPPYMGAKYYCTRLRDFAYKYFPGSKGDLYGAFISRNIKMARTSGYIGMITIPNWMFLSTYDSLRNEMFSYASIQTLIHNGRGVWGPDYGSCAFSIRRLKMDGYSAQYKRLFNRQGEVRSNEDIHASFFTAAPMSREFSFFDELPGRALAYWLSAAMHAAFKKGVALANVAPARQGLATADNGQFVREWHEIDIRRVDLKCNSLMESRSSSKKWFPYNKGGDFRKWYGNQDHVLNWENDGKEIREFRGDNGKIRSAVRNSTFYFRSSISWSDITSSATAFRLYPEGFVYDVAGMSAFAPTSRLQHLVIGFCNSKVAGGLTRALNPTVHFQIGNYQSLPFIEPSDHMGITRAVSNLVDAARADWNSYERSWEFEMPPIVRSLDGHLSLSDGLAALRNEERLHTINAQQLERFNNEAFIDAYGLADELTPDTPLNEITLTCNPHYRYGSDLTDSERETRWLSDTMRELVSYGVGLMMGRYSLAEPGLIYAHADNEGFDSRRYGVFPADDDGIVPITEDPWFADDAATRIEQFLAIAWRKASITETLATLTDGLTQGKGGEPRAALRVYLAKTFYKDHLQNYRNRPIYWLFSSGKLKAFEALVYVHRYNESTLARMRTAYVTPLMGKMQQRITDLDVEIATSASSAEKTRKGRDREYLVRQLAELRTFDEELRHLADQRIKLDLDDGVKVNYGRFGNLLAAKDKVCGKDDKED
jgi:hypothetical protein